LLVCVVVARVMWSARDRVARYEPERRDHHHRIGLAPPAAWVLGL